MPDVSSLVKKTDYDTEVSGTEKKITDHNHEKYITTTAKNTVILPNFLVWKFFGKAQFRHSFGRFAWNFVTTVPIRKSSTQRN